MNPRAVIGIWFAIGLTSTVAGVTLWRYALSTERKTKKRLEELQKVEAADDERAHTYEVLAEMHKLQAQEQPFMVGRGGSATYTESVGCFAALFFVGGIVMLGLSLLAALVEFGQIK